MMNAPTISTGNSHHSVHGKTTIFPISVLKYGTSSHASNKASIKEKKLYTNDSVKNCLIRLLRREPTTFLMPTSLALPADLAVERLMKLMQAMIRMEAG